MKNMNQDPCSGCPTALMGISGEECIENKVCKQYQEWIAEYRAVMHEIFVMHCEAI